MRTAITEVQIKVRGLSLPTYSESDSFHEVCMGSSEARGLTCHRPTDIDRDMQSCTSLKERGPSGVQRLTCDSGYLLDHQARCRTAMPWPETSMHLQCRHVRDFARDTGVAARRAHPQAAAAAGVGASEEGCDGHR